MIAIVAYPIGIAWLCWWVLKRDGTWREAAAVFFAPIIPVCVLASLYGRLPWALFVLVAHVTALVFLPIYWAMRYRGRIGIGFPLFVGAFSGVVCAMVLNGWRIPGKEVVPFVALGLVSGLLFWVIAFLKPPREQGV